MLVAEVITLEVDGFYRFGVLQVISEYVQIIDVAPLASAADCVFSRCEVGILE